MKKIRTGKAEEEDGVEPEIVRWMGKKGKEWMLKIFQGIWKKGEKSTNWENNLIFPILEEDMEELMAEEDLNSDLK